MKKLSSETISLIHHVELHKSGWFDTAIRNIIKSVFGINKNQAIDLKTLCLELSHLLSRKIDNSTVEKQIEKLLQNKEVIKVADDKLQLSQKEFESFVDAVNRQVEVENKAKEKFELLCLEFLIEDKIDGLWKRFNEKLLIPMIKEIGARTIEIIGGKQILRIDDFKQFHDFLEQYSESRDNVKIVISNFLDFSDECVKNYVFRLLNSYFFLEASNLNDNTLNKIYKLSQGQQVVKVFIDTNFLLTILNLHDNPSNDATFLFLELLSEVKNRINVKFYIFPRTIEEFQNLIRRYKKYIESIRPTLQYAKAIEKSEEFSGVIRKYFQKCSELNSMISPDEYFEPYLTNATVILRSKGVELQNEQLDNYVTDQRVIDDMHDQVEFRFEAFKKTFDYRKLNKKERELEKDKIWNKFEHDCIIWHATKDKRPTFIDSPRDVKNWIITLDFRFIYYDRYKQKIGKGSKVSICLHPNEFISMLQFWVPRTEKFEKAIFGNFKLPFLFKDFDLESQKISMSILKALSLYDESKELSNETISEILANNALREKIKPSQSVEENAEFLKAEVFKKLEESKAALEKERQKGDELKGQNAELKNELDEVKVKLASISEKVEGISDQKLKSIEEKLSVIQQNKIFALKAEKEIKKKEIEQIKNRIDDFTELKARAEKEYEESISKILFKIGAFFSGKRSYEELKNKIHIKYYDVEKLKKLENEHSTLTKEYEKSTKTEIDNGKTVIICENKNSILFNKLKFDKLYFFPENNSASVFIKTVSNPQFFGIRDRDFLMDDEINELEEKYSNYIILRYYCFENYLYHPDNLKGLVLDFDYEEYVAHIKNERTKHRDTILRKVDSSRKGYQEFRDVNTNASIKRNNEVQPLIDDLDSNEIDRILKVLSLKDYFNKSIVQTYNLTPDKLVNTDWFKEQIALLLGKINAGVHGP